MIYLNNKQNPLIELDYILNSLEITDAETDLPPISKKEKAIAKIQLLVAEIIAEDISSIRKNNDISFESVDEIIDNLSRNWFDSVKDFAKIVVEEPHLQANINQILENL